jgi:DNA-binding transcriptional MocR family regulator
LLTLRTYRGHGGLICPSHDTLAERVDCHASTVLRALQAARELGLVRWTERRVRAAWRSLRTSNRYRLLLPEAPATPCPPGWRTTLHNAGGGERKLKQEAHEHDRGALASLLAAAERLPDLLMLRRKAWEGGLVRG